MLNIVLFGPPGAGKGTQSARLVERYNLVHLSTGDIFRWNIREETDLGRQARSFMERGALVPDGITIGMLGEELKKHPGANGFIFDGFPRTEAQAEALDEFMAGRGDGISAMIALEVPEEELKKRLVHRGDVSGRPDDMDPDIINNRLQVYRTETAPVAGYYKKQKKYVAIHGLGSVDDIADRINHEVEKLKHKPNVVVHAPVLEKPIFRPVVEPAPAAKKPTAAPAAKKPATAAKKPVPVPAAKKPAPAAKKATPAPPAPKAAAVKKPAASAGNSKNTAKKAAKKGVVKSDPKKVVKKTAVKKVAKKAAVKKVTKKASVKKIVKKVVKKVAVKVTKKAAAKGTKKSAKKPVYSGRPKAVAPVKGKGAKSAAPARSTSSSVSTRKPAAKKAGRSVGASKGKSSAAKATGKKQGSKSRSVAGKKKKR